MDLIFYFSEKRLKINKHINVLDDLNKIVGEIISSNEELSNVEIDSCSFGGVKLDVEEPIINLPLNDDDLITINSKSGDFYANDSGFGSNNKQRNNYYTNNEKTGTYLLFTINITGSELGEEINLLPFFSDEHIEEVCKRIKYIKINGEKKDGIFRHYTFIETGQYEIFIKFKEKLCDIPVKISCKHFMNIEYKSES